jgi:hypothetical protein
MQNISQALKATQLSLYRIKGGYPILSARDETTGKSKLRKWPSRYDFLTSLLCYGIPYQYYNNDFGNISCRTCHFTSSLPRRATNSANQIPECGAASLLFMPNKVLYPVWPSAFSCWATFSRLLSAPRAVQPACVRARLVRTVHFV